MERKTQQQHPSGTSGGHLDAVRDALLLELSSAKKIHE
jgi:hypothetical protein